MQKNIDDMRKDFVIAAGHMPSLSGTFLFNKYTVSALSYHGFCSTSHGYALTYTC